MARKIKIFLDKVQKNEFRQMVCNLNWRYHKPELIDRLHGISNEINTNDYWTSVYDYTPSGRSKIVGNEAVVLKFFFQKTGIEYIEDDVCTIDYEHGSQLSIAHSDVGYDTVFLSPAKSKQSGAEHEKLIIYSNAFGKRLSDAKLQDLVQCLLLYHMYTSVLFRKTPLLRLKVSWLRFRSYIYAYFSPEKKFKYSTGVYIPLASLFISAVALIVAFLSLKN